MNTRLLPVAIAAAWLTAFGPGTGAAPNTGAADQKQDVTAEFRPVMGKVMAGWSTLDPANVAAYYAKDADAVFFDVAPLKYQGWGEYADGVRKATAAWKSLKCTINPDFVATREGNVAWATFTAHFEIEMKKGPGMKGEMRSTEIWEKRGGQWLIVHEHASAPLPGEEPAPARKK